MGRGLSDLQRRILRLALGCHGERSAKPETTVVLPIVGVLKSGYNGVDLYTHEILIECFGFVLNDHTYHSPGSQKFSRDENPGYDAARAAVSRALRRLNQRGLATIYSGAYSRWTGIGLTPDGLQLAEQLSPAITESV